MNNRPRVKSYEELSDIEKEDLARMGGAGVRDISRPDPRQIISEAANPAYNSSEDIPQQFRNGTIDQMYDKYADDSPVHGNWLKLKRMIGTTLSQGKEK
jgi:hypothetical protein